MNESAISFGPFRLLSARRLLLEGDKPVRLGGRAFDILAALVEHAGQVVSREELISRAWPRTFVEDANLKIQISALRRALGDGQGGHRYVVTVPGRGYSFVAPVSLEEHSQAALPATVMPATRHNLPFAITRIIDREDAVAALLSRFSRERLLTVVGPGGVGKTTVALAVAERMLDRFEEGVWLVDLAPLADPHLVPSAVASVLGVEVRSENPLPGIVAGLRDRRMLLLLDNCEHVIDAAASLAGALLGGVPGVKILATSREPLGVAGEREYRLGPLDSPPRSSRSTAAAVATFPAVQLFVERVTAIIEDFTLTDANAPTVGEICRRLDGLPLAIEFAAPRVEALGIEGLAARLDDTLPLLGTRSRAAGPRHRTMRAVVDWSYGLLGQDEQRIFGALGVFSGGFTVEAAAAVAMDPANTRNDAIERLADLAVKSLLVADVGGAKPRFRLLDTTRAYAIEKLAESGEGGRIARRHAEYYLTLFARFASENPLEGGIDDLGEYRRDIDNLRAALDWAFSPAGDATMGVSLTIAAVQLWMHLSLMEECRRRVEQGLASLSSGEDRGERREMQLLASLGAALLYTKGATPETRAAFARALELADSFDDTDYRLRALWGLWVDRMNEGAVRDAQRLAEAFVVAAARSADPIAVAVGERMMGFSLHFAGDQGAAQIHLERMLGDHVPALGKRPIARFQFDPWVTARTRLAVILWLKGYPDQATRLVESGLDEAIAINHAVTLCNVLAQGACPVAMLTGDLKSAERYVAMLSENAAQAGLEFWEADARCFAAFLLIRRGEVEAGLHMLRRALHPLATETGHTRYDAYLGELAQALGHVGDVPGGLATIERALERSERTEGRWYVAELLRIKGELILMRGGQGADAETEGCFLRSFDWAFRQDALSWRLRTATSLARLLSAQGRSEEGLACLQPTYERFTEGFDTVDLIAAKRVLDGLAHVRTKRTPIGRPKNGQNDKI
jgi:predicted ATPase/DNA-binding winged helix-turn-helix (wHTH) protein